MTPDSESTALPGAPPDASARRRTPEHWVVLVLSVGAFLGMAVVGFLLEPDERGYGTHEALGLAPCLFVELWDLPCPGCGVTTAVAHAARGDLLASLLAQPFGLALALGVLVAGVWTPWAHFRGRDIGLELRVALIGRGRWAIWIGVLVLASWVYKAWDMRL